jgi:hypothetical protein
MTIWILALACRSAGSESGPAPARPPADASARGPDGGTLPLVCEASALLRSEGRLLLADNEAPGRIYDAASDLSALHPIPLGSDVDDIEALAGDAARDFWVVGSQSNDKNAKERPERKRVAHVVDGRVSIVTPDLSICAACTAVRALAPKEGGVNVEGAAIVAGGLWLGLRSPLVDGKAILLGMSADGARAERLVLVDLGGDGVREMVAHEGALLVVSGPVDDRAQPHRLWRMAGPDTPPALLPAPLPAQTEGIAVVGDSLVWVTDGNGKPGKCATASRWGSLQGALGRM